MTLTEVINRFQLKEHLYTFELPPKRDPPPIELIFTAQVAHIVHMSSTKFHPNPMTLVRVINRFQLKERKSTFESPADTKSTYIPLSCYQNAIPSDLAHIHRVASQHTRHTPH